MKCRLYVNSDSGCHRTETTHIIPEIPHVKSDSSALQHCERRSMALPYSQENRFEMVHVCVPMFPTEQRTATGRSICICRDHLNDKICFCPIMSRIYIHARAGSNQKIIGTDRRSCDVRTFASAIRRWRRSDAGADPCQCVSTGGIASREATFSHLGRSLRVIA